MVKNTGPQVGDDAAHVVNRCFDLSAHVLALAAHGVAHGLRCIGTPLLLLTQALVQPAHVHLEGHQQAAQLVMHLSRNAGTFVFPHAVSVGREFTQLRQGFLQFMCALTDALLHDRMGLFQSVFSLATG